MNGVKSGSLLSASDRAILRYAEDRERVLADLEILTGEPRGRIARIFERYQQACRRYPSRRGHPSEFRAWVLDQVFDLDRCERLLERESAR